MLLGARGLCERAPLHLAGRQARLDGAADGGRAQRLGGAAGRAARHQPLGHALEHPPQLLQTRARGGRAGGQRKRAGARRAQTGVNARARGAPGDSHAHSSPAERGRLSSPGPGGCTRGAHLPRAVRPAHALRVHAARPGEARALREEPPREELRDEAAVVLLGGRECGAQRRAARGTALAVDQRAVGAVQQQPVRPRRAGAQLPEARLPERGGRLRAGREEQERAGRVERRARGQRERRLAADAQAPAAERDGRAPGVGQHGEALAEADLLEVHARSARGHVCRRRGGRGAPRLASLFGRRCNLALLARLGGLCGRLWLGVATRCLRGLASAGALAEALRPAGERGQHFACVYSALFRHPTPSCNRPTFLKSSARIRPDSALEVVRRTREVEMAALASIQIGCVRRYVPRLPLSAAPGPHRRPLGLLRACLRASAGGTRMRRRESSAASSSRCSSATTSSRSPRRSRSSCRCAAAASANPASLAGRSQDAGRGRVAYARLVRGARRREDSSRARARSRADSACSRATARRAHRPLSAPPLPRPAAQRGEAYVELFVVILQNVNKEETVQYVLALLDDLLVGEDRRSARPPLAPHPWRMRCRPAPGRARRLTCPARSRARACLAQPSPSWASTGTSCCATRARRWTPSRR